MFCRLRLVQSLEDLRIVQPSSGPFLMFSVDSLFPFIGSSYTEMCNWIVFNIQSVSILGGNAINFYHTSSRDPLKEHCYHENHFIYQNNINLLSL